MSLDKSNEKSFLTYLHNVYISSVKQDKEKGHTLTDQFLFLYILLLRPMRLCFCRSLFMGWLLRSLTGLLKKVIENLVTAGKCFVRLRGLPATPWLICLCSSVNLYLRRSWAEGNSTRRAPLAVRSREDWIQARCDGVPVSARRGTLLPCWSPHPILWCCSSPSLSTICQQQLSHCASLSTQHVHVRLSGVRLRRSDSLELAAGWI